jgi:hypothetical protein
MLRPIALAVLIGLPAAAPIASPPPAPATQTAPATPTAEDDDIELLDETREQIHDAVESLVREIDSWFGDVPFEQGGRVAGRIGLRFLWRQDEGTDWLTRFGIRVRVPNLERLGGFLFVGRDNEREVVSDRPEAFTRRQQLLQETRGDQSFFAGLGAQVAEGIALRAGLRGGLKPYAQARYTKLWDLTERSDVEFRQTFFWTTNDGYGSTTALNYGYLLNPTLTLRWQSAATWAQNNEGMLWGSSLGVYRSFGALRQLSLETLVDGQTGIGVGITQYGLRVRWEQPVYKDWLLLEVLGGHFWPRPSEPEPRGSAWAFGASLQLNF